ncbi:MAG: metalloregulator ArsR/SmtB family transcription factor [bacterium]|nr:metalloregulator ArsR/SmtB family transcription factor [bacterium]
MATRSEQGAQRSEQVLEALGNPVRRRLLLMLAGGPSAVGELAANLPVSRPAVSRHLRLLEAADFVAHESEGTRNLYRLKSAGFAEARAWLDSFWDDAMTRFTILAENTKEEADR